MDSLILSLDRALRTLSGSATARRANPADAVDNAKPLDASEARLAASLMRVNHAGEVAAQALYQGQALTSRTEALRAKLDRAADEELDHLAWTRERVHELGGRTSLLDPFWYAGAFAIGAVAGAIGDKVSLGFLEATEEQVEAHLASHLDRLPAGDARSRAIVEQMKADEAQHAQTARELGATSLSLLTRTAMRGASRVMTTLAAKI